MGQVLVDQRPKATFAHFLFVLNDHFVYFQNFPGCEEIPSGVIDIIKKKTEVDTPLCRVKSGVDGLFVFPSVPSGEYTLVTRFVSIPQIVYCCDVCSTLCCFTHCTRDILGTCGNNDNINDNVTKQ